MYKYLYKYMYSQMPKAPCTHFHSHKPHPKPLYITCALSLSPGAKTPLIHTTMYLNWVQPEAHLP